MAQLIIVCAASNWGASSLTKIWIRSCFSLFSAAAAATVLPVVLQIQFIFDEALRFGLLLSSLPEILGDPPCVLVPRRRHTHTQRHTRNRRRRNKTKPSTQSEIVPPFLSGFLFIFHCPLWSTTCRCMSVYLCEGFVSRFARVARRGFTLLLPFDCECHALKNTQKVEEKSEKGTVKSSFDRTSCARRRLW